MTTKKTNRPIFDASKSAAAADTKATGTRLAAFAAMKAAGVTPASIKGNGADYADFKEGVLVGWQGAAFAKKFLSTSDGAAILTGRKIIGQNDFEPVTKTKNEWSTDVSGKVGKLRAAYVEWVTPAADPAADAVTDPMDPASTPAKPAKPAKPARKSGQRKAIKDRIADDIAAIKAAVDRDADADVQQLTPAIRNDLMTAFIKIQDLVKK